MITVNLKPGARQGGVGEQRTSIALLRERISGISLGVREPWRVAALASWVLAIAGLGFVYVTSGRQLAAMEPELVTARADSARYAAFMTEKRQQTGIRDSIIGQIRTIRTVDRDRYIWPHILDEIANALPDYTWLTEVSFLPPPTGVAIDTTLPPPPTTFRIIGRTGDLQNYTAFQRQLEASPWLTNILPIEAKVLVEKNRALFTFTIQASFAVADSAHIRTVPILESVVR
jgi:Tfp pilus assembly protein PilN